MEDIHSSYIPGLEDVDKLPYPLPSLGQNEACVPMSCPGGVEIVLVGGGEPTVGTYPEETGVLPSYTHIGYREENREGIRSTHSREPDELNCGTVGRSEQDHTSSKHTLPPPDCSTLHHLAPRQPGIHSTPWRYSDTPEEMERESEKVVTEEQYLQHRRFQWTSGFEDGETNSHLMMVRSDPPPITMPAFRRALQLGKTHEAWQGGNYSEEDAQIEVEEDEESSVYTCIECSIYFKKKAHLLEHMFQHSQEGEGEGLHGGEGPHTCGECGKGFGDEQSLESHRQLHQESRKKIIEEIGKLESLIDEGRDARLQCPKCLFGTNSSKVFVQHAKTHVKKVGGDAKANTASIRALSEVIDGGKTSEPPSEGISKVPETETLTEHGLRIDVSQSVVQGSSKVTEKTLEIEEFHSSLYDQHFDGEICRPRSRLVLPEAAVQLKNKFQEALRAVVGDEEVQRRQLREEVAIVLLENIGSKKRQMKGQKSWGYVKSLPLNTNVFSHVSLAHHQPREEWADDEEDDVPLDTLLMDPKYASQLEALGLRSEERECPYCPDRFHNGIGLANHVRGHLNRVGVSYNVRHFISAEEVKAIEQNYSFQKKRKKALGSDEDDGSPIDLGLAQMSQTEQSPAEKMVSDQSVSKGDDSKGQVSITCELCGACFETRKGLSSHARSHLRQLGIPGSETSGAPIDLLKELAKQGKLAKDESSLGAKKVDGPQQESPKSQWGNEDMPLNLTMEDDEEESNRENDCQFCGAWFETRKGLSSHCRAHLRHLGVNDPDAKGSPIASLNALIKSDEFKKRMSGHTPADIDTLTKVAGESNPTDTVHDRLNRSPKAKEPGTFARPIESTKKMSSDSPAGTSKGVSRSITVEGGLKLTECAGPIESSAHFKSPTAMGNTKQIKIVEAGAPRVLSPEASAHTKISEVRSTQVKLEAGRDHGKMELDIQRKPSLGGLAHHRPHPTSAPSAKKMKESPAACKSNLDPFWAQKNTSAPLNLSSQSDPTRDIRCEFCSEFFENRKGLSSHARSHLRQMGITEWHVNGSPIDTLREIIRKRSLSAPPQAVSNIKKEPRSDDEPPSPSHRLSPIGVATPGMARDLPISPTSRPHNSFLSPLPTKRPAPHEPRLVQSEPKGFLNTDPKTCNQLKPFIQREARPKSYIHDEELPKTFIQADGRPKPFLHNSEGFVKTFMHDGRPKGFLPSENRPKPFMQGEGKPKTLLQGDARPKSFMPGQSRPKQFLHGEPKHKVFSPDGKPKAYIQTELPFKVKVKASPEKAVTSLEANCELCGLVFENRKALASHARAHLRQFGVTEWCVNGSPIETLREWMKQRPQKAGAYLNYIQGRPFSKKFKRALQSPKSGPEKESPTVTPVKVAEKDHPIATLSSVTEKPAEPQGQKTERRHPKAPEVPCHREDPVSELLSKNEDSRPPVRVRPVPSLVPRPPQTSLVKFVGNIYTLKCRFCDIQFQGPLSIQEQWVRHLQHHILEMNFSKFPSPPHTVSSQEQPEATKSQ